MGEFLKKNALKFLEIADYLLSKEDFNFAAFNYEQSAQLFLKYLLWKKVGDYPKTHSLLKLIDECAKIIEQKDKIETLENLKETETIFLLEEAYLATRYFDVQFNRTPVEKMKKLVYQIKEIVESLT
ncbi:MAG: HEPN domain-containing protein [Candidatus Kryptonium sp.]|nr:HEPN domain-containing protein [Candidatus Kryptonium sp.]MCX7761953.1 HEPN domain-containing protein [Candidatus Kryptonium sp.]MDW8108715.1 HEPN domain-containing protein [Candidatus Kryptonium sp.]